MSLFESYRNNMSSCQEKSWFCQYICSKGQQSLFQKSITSACLLALFFFIFYFIYIKENPCIINELGKYFQNDIDLQSKSDLHFITGEKFEEMHIVMNKVTRFASLLDF